MIGSAYRKRLFKRYAKEKNPCEHCPVTLTTAVSGENGAMACAGGSGIILRRINNARAGSADRKRLFKRYAKGKNPCERSPVTLAAACIRRKRGDGMRRLFGNRIGKERRIRENRTVADG